MLQTNLIGRTFVGALDKEMVYTVVAAFVSNGNFIVLGECNRGQLHRLTWDQVILKPVPIVEDLRGVI